jgi:DNA-binding PadR family transcriptional regulator
MISSEFIKGCLETIILKVLEDEGPLHGYGIARKVETLTKGKLNIPDSALYPVLHRLKKEKCLVTASELKGGRLRIYYSLTPKGHNTGAKKVNELREFSAILQQIVEPQPATENMPA